MSNVVCDSTSGKAAEEMAIEDEVSMLMEKSIGACVDVLSTETAFYTAAEDYAAELYRRATECVARVKIM